jgi:hypothetical protein
VITKVTTADAFNRYGFYSVLAFAIFFSLASVSSHQSSLALATLIPCLNGHQPVWRVVPLRWF